MAARQDIRAARMLYAGLSADVRDNFHAAAERVCDAWYRRGMSVNWVGDVVVLAVALVARTGVVTYESFERWLPLAAYRIGLAELAQRLGGRPPRRRQGEADESAPVSALHHKVSFLEANLMTADAPADSGLLMQELCAAINASLATMPPVRQRAVLARIAGITTDDGGRSLWAVEGVSRATWFRHREAGLKAVRRELLLRGLV